MAKVMAKCIAQCWDSVSATVLYPGFEYEIEHDGKLATLRKGSKWAFEFDRTMAGTGLSPAIGGFVCRHCNKAFDSLNELGLHSRQKHSDKVEAEQIVVTEAGLDAVAASEESKNRLQLAIEAQRADRAIR